jgi:hypothetical protein
MYNGRLRSNSVLEQTRRQKRHVVFEETAEKQREREEARGDVIIPAYESTGEELENGYGKEGMPVAVKAFLVFIVLVWTFIVSILALLLNSMISGSI